MGKRIYTEIEINATVDVIWEILLDFKKYPNWNSFIKHIEGKVSPGNMLMVKIHPPGGSMMTFKPQVITHIRNKQLSWKGKLIFNGLFDGTHYFELIPLDNHKTKFIQREEFSGFFVRFFNPVKTQRGFETMNMKLKELAEKRVLDVNSPGVSM